MTKPLTEKELAEIKERAEKATERPWRIGKQSPNGLNNVGTTGGLLTAQTFSEYDANFIAHAREDIPKLIAEVERLRKVLEFYADKSNYREMPLLDIASMYDENGIRVAEQEWAPPAVHYDYGEKAKKALGGDNE